MRTNIVKNSVVLGAFLACTLLLVFLEVRILEKPPSGAWFVMLIGLALAGLGWVNAGSFAGLAQPRRAITATAAVVGAWLVATLVVVTVGVNFKFALGGHL